MIGIMILLISYMFCFSSMGVLVNTDVKSDLYVFLFIITIIIIIIIIYLLIFEGFFFV